MVIAKERDVSSRSTRHKFCSGLTAALILSLSLCENLASAKRDSDNQASINHASSTASTGTKHASPTVKPRQRRVFKSVDEIITLYGASVRNKLKPIFSTQSVAYPPKDMTWVALKQEKVLLLFAKDEHGKTKQVLSDYIIGQSGGAGPKLKEGDMQVPEGFYRVTGFHPNVIAHMALDVNYPNEEDRAHAVVEKRKNLGRDILIHGSRWSSGCLAMGNVPMEELFVLAYDCGLKNIKLIFAPCNLLSQQPKIDYKKQPPWLPQLYKRISTALRQFPIDITNVPPAETLEQTKATY